jgi:hypothetical protein
MHAYIHVLLDTTICMRWTSSLPMYTDSDIILDPFSKLLCVHVCMHVHRHVHMHVCACLCVCVHVWL